MMNLDLGRRIINDSENQSTKQVGLVQLQCLVKLSPELVYQLAHEQAEPLGEPTEPTGMEQVGLI